MVDYRGPSAIRPLVERLNLPIFDRITEIRFKDDQLDVFPITQAEFSVMRDLEHLELTKRRGNVGASEMDSITQRIPTCRQDSVVVNGRKLAVDLTQNAGCSD